MDVRSEKDAWGGRLGPWPRDVLAKTGLAPDDAEYLAQVGLPVGVAWNLTIPTPDAGAEPPRAKGLIVVAFDGPVPLCVDPRMGGSVVAIEDAGRRTVNSNVRLFGRFLVVYHAYRLGVRDLEEADAERLIDEVAEAMVSLDPAAMADGESYWPVVVEQMRDGLL